MTLLDVKRVWICSWTLGFDLLTWAGSWAFSGRKTHAGKTQEFYYLGPGQDCWVLDLR